MSVFLNSVLRNRIIPRVCLSLVLGLLLAAGGVLSAQQPSSTQIEQRLRNDSALVRRLRGELTRSGLTSDQVRARLRAAGYPESLLNEYLSDSTTFPETSNSDSAWNAVRALGLIDSSVVDDLRQRRLSAQATSAEVVPYETAR